MAVNAMQPPDPVILKTPDHPKKQPVEGRRVLLRGFTETDESLASAFVNGAGGQLVQSLQAADLVIIGPSGADKVVALARQRQLKVLNWTEVEAPEKPGSTAVPSSLEDRSAIEIAPGHVRILDVIIPRGGSAPPVDTTTDRFANLCLDEPFLRAARAVALGVLEGLPTALEGTTAASKTTVVLWLARLLGHAVFRLNLHGQTDTGELVGRYVPTRGGEDWDLASLVALGSRLREETRDLIDEALAAGRPLTWAERTFIAARERFQERTWRFAEGILPQALRSGAWVLLDELNLAEPQILERINPVLESPPSLLLSEGDQTHWGPGGLPVHEHFRMFATLNPAEYTGRSVLSPAFRDRWLQWHFAEVPREVDYRAQLRFLIEGVHPQFRVGRVRYQALPGKPLLPGLAQVPGIDDFLSMLACFHVAMASAGGEGGRAPSLGRGRRERYVFTRRSLEACVRLWDSMRRRAPGSCPRGQLASALATVYLNKLSPGADRNAAIGLAEVAGLPLEEAA
jgi:MoxR-like ATPase